MRAIELRPAVCVLTGLAILMLASTPAPAAEDCPGGGDLHVHHDSTFENGHAFFMYGEPPINSFAEAFDLGPGWVRCGVFWLCALETVPPAPSEVYVWDWDYAHDRPGNIIARVQDVEYPHIGIWPEFGENVIPIDVEVSGRFALGIWSGFDGPPVWYLGTDENGQGGFPLLYTICGDYPDWCSPDMFWPVQSFGIGASFEPVPTPARPTTWGAIKALYD